MKKYVILFSSTILISQTAIQAKNHFYLIGGGGEPKTETTIFDGALTALDFNLKQNTNWHRGFYFNGGHSVTENILSKIPSEEPVKNFTPKDYDDFLANTVKKIKNGDIKSGEKLMIYVDTHGAIRANNGSELSHSVSASGDGAMVNLDKLESVLIEAKKNNIKVALIDTSCHAGATMALEKHYPEMCLITASSERNFSYTDFSHNLMNNLKSGVNLEEAFHFARKASLAKGVPLINSAVGKKAQELMRDFQPLLFDASYDPIGSSNNKLEAFLDHEIFNGSACHELTVPSSIQDVIEKAEKMTTIQRRFLFFSFTEKKDFSSLKQAVKEHYQLLNEAVKLRAKILPSAYRKIKLQPPMQNIELSWAELARIKFDDLIKEANETLRFSTDNKQRFFAENNLHYYSAIKATVEKIKQQDDFKKTEALQSELDFIYKRIEDSANNFAQKEREFYDLLYSELAKTELGKEPNPCREFTF